MHESSSDPPPAAGKIVVLNGPSSAGKTTLATALRDAGSQKIAAVSLDQFFACVARSQPNNWQLFATLTEAAFATALALSNGGFHVVVDTVFERADSFDMMKSMLAERDVALVAVTSDLDVLETRERARGNRRSGQARSQLERVIQNGSGYDLVLDTSVLSVKQCVERVLGLLGM